MSKPKVMICITKEVTPYNARYGRRNRRPLAVGTTMSAALVRGTTGFRFGLAIVPIEWIRFGLAIVPIEWRRNGLIDSSCFRVLDVIECLALRAHPFWIE